MPRVAVVGGSGFIGSHLVERLISAGHSVLVIGRNAAPGKIPAQVAGACEFASADIQSADALTEALTKFGPWAVYHLAGLPDGRESFSHIRGCIETNLLGSLNVFEAAVSAGASLFVFGDSSKDYGNGEIPYRTSQADSPICSYAVAKSSAWRLCQIAAQNLPIQICGIRPTLVYGPRQSYCLVQYVYDCHRSGKPVRLQGGKQTRDLLHVSDAVAAYYKVLDSPKAWGSAIPIGGGNERSIADWCRAMLKAFGSDLEVVEDADTLRSTEIWRSYCDNEEASRLLGWSPERSLDDGLKDLYPEIFASGSSSILGAEVCR